MKVYVVIVSMLHLSSINTGNICSGTTHVKPIKRHYSFSSALVRHSPEIAHDQKIKREKEIRYAVALMALPTIYLLHSRINYDDYGQLNMNSDELIIFRNAVTERYNNNVVEINALVSESIERYRQQVHRLAVRQKNMNRRRRLAWRSEDHERFMVSQRFAEPTEEKKS